MSVPNDIIVDGVFAEKWFFRPVADCIFAMSRDDLFAGKQPFERDGHFYFAMRMDAEERRLARLAYKNFISGKTQTVTVDLDELMKSVKSQN